MSASPDASLPVQPAKLAAALGWLADGARSAARSQDVLEQLCVRLVECGLPLWRVAVFVRTLHPLLMGRGFVWRPDHEVEVGEAPFQLLDDTTFLASPVQKIYLTGEAIRRRLADPDCPDDFPFLNELRADNVTDYLALPLNFTNGEIHVATFTTRQPGGFSENHVAALEAIGPPLSRVAEVRALRVTAISLLDAYVGHKAGEHILAGRIRRGDVERIRAVIWLSDMRGFTRRADAMAPASLIETLNLFFDNLVPPIESEGGEVLKFMGDGLLAIFRISESADADEACSRALRAAKAAQTNIAALTGASPGEGVEPLRFGLALHLGEALYGNIGAGTRLDFTCIGPSVNRAARLEKVASRLGRTVVASAAFARHRPEEFIALGDFELAGFREPEKVFGLRDELG
ncbi:MAG: adenylate/guanylate cyclase domain-containing protein [Roseiarcus sp.]